MSHEIIQDFFETARRECPPLFGVTAIRKLFPDVISPGTIHNAISAGVGPMHRKVNGRIVLERDSFLLWLADRPRVGQRAGRARDGQGA
ncbi:MAG: hypothetical protein AB7E51_14670 [Pseudodesulfovibrio sp.]|uniref:hypothetical protein n=1 Tax=Pseudodesulfovibrio sp. TaxID=2035812 RepID=UPI003D13DD65